MIYRLMLALLLLSCGVGWAAPVESIGGNWKVSALPPPCYERMKEAMKSAEQYKFWQMFTLEDQGSIRFSTSVVGDTYPAGCDEVCRRKLDLDDAIARKKKRDEELAAKQRWDTVMNDCVK